MIVNILLIILFSISASSNYIAYTHIRRYKYYKQSVSLTIEHSIIGLFIGLPFIFMPFSMQETDKGYLKYSKVRNSLLWARVSTSLLFSVLAYLALEIIIKRWF